MNIDAIQDRIDRLKNILAECPEPIGKSEDMQRILRTAPQVLQVVESAITNTDCDQSTLRQIHEKLKKAETLIFWAVGVTKGKVDADDMMSGKMPDATLPPDRRFTQQMSRFMFPKINKTIYNSLVREFSGGNAIQDQLAHLISNLRFLSFLFIYNGFSTGFVCVFSAVFQGKI